MSYDAIALVAGFVEVLLRRVFCNPPKNGVVLGGIEDPVAESVGAGFGSVHAVAGAEAAVDESAPAETAVRRLGCHSMHNQAIVAVVFAADNLEIVPDRLD